MSPEQARAHVLSLGRCKHSPCYYGSDGFTCHRPSADLVGHAAASWHEGPPRSHSVELGAQAGGRPEPGAYLPRPAVRARAKR